MDAKSGEIESYAPSQAVPTGKIELSFKEAEFMKTVSFEDRVKTLGAIRFVQQWKGDRLLNVARKIAFMAGYDFAMTLHKMRDLQESDLPTAPTEETKDANTNRID